MLERTQKVQYEIPANARISPACRHFLSQLLVGDPNKRLSTAGIMEHPWFRHGLPQGVYSLNDECLRLKVLLLPRLKALPGSGCSDACGCAMLCPRVSTPSKMSVSASRCCPGPARGVMMHMQRWPGLPRGV